MHLKVRVRSTSESQRRVSGDDGCRRFCSGLAAGKAQPKRAQPWPPVIRGCQQPTSPRTRHTSNDRFHQNHSLAVVPYAPLHVRLRLAGQIRLAAMAPWPSRHGDPTLRRAFQVHRLRRSNLSWHTQSGRPLAMLHDDVAGNAGLRGMHRDCG